MDHSLIGPLAFALLATLAMLPLAVSIHRSAPARDKREAAVAMCRAQLAELDRDLADGQIGVAEHASARLEVQRRLLTAADAQEEMLGGDVKTPLRTALFVVPMTALTLYLPDSSPSIPSANHSTMVAQAEAAPGQVNASITKLRARLATLDPKSEAARAAYTELGKAEASRGNMAAAAAFWGLALAVHFDPTLAVVTAEALTETVGHVTAESAALFRRALAEAPASASWRSIAQRRLNEDITGGKDGGAPTAIGK